MILAGVLLKLGGYGLIRLFSVFYQEILFFSSFLLTISLIGGMLACFICFRQVDRKSLIAYSSVAHIALVLTGLVIITTYG
jgi:NADH-ubiquinone oxidoreductase chain 4